VTNKENLFKIIEKKSLKRLKNRKKRLKKFLTNHITMNNVMSHLVTVTKHFRKSRFLAVTFRDITLYVVNNYRIARTIN
jgi:hypothetical protein